MFFVWQRAYGILFRTYSTSGTLNCAQKRGSIMINTVQHGDDCGMTERGRGRLKSAIPSYVIDRYGISNGAAVSYVAIIICHA